MSNHELAAMILTMAEKDLDTLQRMLKDTGFPEEIFGFHAQQAVEKAFKAWLSFVGVEYPKTHDLSTLVDLLVDSGEEVPKRFEVLVYLTPFGVRFRYQPYTPLQVPVQRPEVTELVRGLIQHTSARLEKT